MNLLELQVLAVVSGIPDANDARWTVFMFEPAPLDPDPRGVVSNTEPVPAAPDDVSAKRPA